MPLNDLTSPSQSTLSLYAPHGASQSDTHIQGDRRVLEGKASSTSRTDVNHRPSGHLIAVYYYIGGDNLLES